MARSGTSGILSNMLTQHFTRIAGVTGPIPIQRSGTWERGSTEKRQGHEPRQKDGQTLGQTLVHEAKNTLFSIVDVDA